MRYLVLYKDWSADSYDKTKWEEFELKEPAIQFARDNKGTILEVFEFDIKKTKKNEA